MSDSGPSPSVANYKNNSLTVKDVGDKPSGMLGGPSPDQIVDAINNKGKNLDRWKNAPSNYSSSFLVKEKQSVDGQIGEMDTFSNRQLAAKAGRLDQYDQDLAALKARRDYLNGEISKN